MNIQNKRNGTLEDAIAIAAQAHQGQVDKSNSPYILHPLRMMMQMKSETAMIVAVLHDVVEDVKIGHLNDFMKMDSRKR